MNNKADRVANPVRFYCHPDEVERDRLLTKAEKVILLKNWLDDIKLREIADNENMLAAKPHPYLYVAEIEQLLEYYEHH